MPGTGYQVIREATLREVLEHFLRAEMVRPKYTERREDLVEWLTLDDAAFLQRMREFAASRNDVNPVLTWVGLDTWVVWVWLPSVWYVVEVAPRVKPRRSQPFANVVLILDLLLDASRLLLLNVRMFASQQIELVSVGGGGEKVTGLEVVRSSRS